jgi:phage baseplate assembly protein V
MGMSAVPEAGADVLVLQIGGPDHLVALQADAAGLRAPGLGPGDIALRDRRGQQVTLNADGVRITGALRVTIIASGDVSVETPTQVTVTAPEAHFTGNVTIDGSIVVGGGGGASTLSGDLTMTGTFILDGVTQNTHRHTNVQPGGGTSGGPVN